MNPEKPATILLYLSMMFFFVNEMALRLSPRLYDINAVAMMAMIVSPVLIVLGMDACYKLMVTLEKEGYPLTRGDRNG